jgi:wobble nucleotide-excising tRNase
MISRIDIRNVATFGDAVQSLNDLRKINYFFGANGTGKTTISRIIADSTQFHDCNISWTNEDVLETIVYNRDFIDRNFNQEGPLKGVFTLGEKQIETLRKIESIKADVDKLTDEINSLGKTLQGEDGNGGKISELSNIENEYREKFFSAKQMHDKKLAGGFEGVRGSKEKFKDKVLAESVVNTAVLAPLSELEQKTEKVFSDTLALAQKVPIPQTEKILAHEQNIILKKRIIGKEDVDIAAIIKKLNNSDWVRQGLSYYEANDDICPFCQRKTDDDFKKSLKEYFDETFEQDNISINSLTSDYLTDGDRIRQEIQGIIDLAPDFLEIDKLKNEKQILDSLLVVNNQKLVQKKKETSQIFELNSLANVLNAIITIISDANIKIDEHNAIVNNLSNEKKILTDKIWKFVVEELKDDISEYNYQTNNINSAIKNIKEQIDLKTSEKQTKTKELRALEKQTTSIQPALDGINSLLVAFGFKSFSLAKDDDGKTYKLVRENGDDARKSLSEGEKNFVTFLYFYYLLRGSHSDSGIISDKIVVFDDPVSSLDSDILFIVSSLIRELFEDVRNRKGIIKQICILTHNIYFHKEVSYNSKKSKNKACNDDVFWIVKKQLSTSVVERYDTNPIKTAYELLWHEVRTECRNNVTIQNTLRRILENYFKLLGGIPLDRLYTKFNGDDKIKCKALCSWVNDGSHSVFDNDYYTPLDDVSVEKYLQIFKQIFEHCHQIEHYNMMMGIEEPFITTESSPEAPDD